MRFSPFIEIAHAHYVYNAILIIIDNKISEILQSGPKTSLEIAKITNLNAYKVYQMLKYATSYGLFNEKEKDLWENNTNSIEMGKISNLFKLTSTHIPFLGDLKNIAKTGETISFEGKSFYKYLMEKPDLGIMFNNAMTELSSIFMPSILEKYDFSKCGLIVDVGGGVGQLLIDILKKYQHLQGILFDQKEVIEMAAKEFVPKSGVGDRIKLEHGDFLISVPEADTIIMKNVLHNWDEEKKSIILGNTHKVLKPRNGKLLILEFVLVNVGANSKFAAGINFLMNSLFNSRLKSVDEWKETLSKNGFQLNSVVQLMDDFGIIEATPL